MRILNWKRGPVSPHKFSVSEEKPLPERVDLKALQSPVRDQGAAGSCVSNALANALEFLQLQQIRKVLGMGPEEFPGLKYDEIARLFIYFNDRLMEGDPEQDGGSNIFTGIVAIGKYGFCQESTWPYDLTNLYIPPTAVAYAEAAKHKETKGYCLEDGNLHQIKKALATGYPVVFGVDLCDSFMNIGSDGVYKGPLPDEQPVGGHCMLIVAYDDHQKLLTVKNSWSTDFGDKGYVYLGYDFAPAFSDMHVIL